jgi:CO dehydrogenase/acetyl-CoA synthase gamma subunit (corrinoid Fe-S protein)
MTDGESRDTGNIGYTRHRTQDCLVYPMLPVSLDSPFVITLWFSLTFICLVSCVSNVASVSRLCFLDCPLVFSNVYLSCVLCLVYPMLPVSLDSPSVITLWFSLTFICLVSCVSNVARVSRLCILDCPLVFSNVYLSCVLCLV